MNQVSRLRRPLAHIRVERLGHGLERGPALRPEPVVPAEQYVAHALPEILREQSVEKWVDSRVQV